ncbi:6-carboxy-5,6,7,8-tetrahydropterin synthase [Cloacibacterium rupense]|uniref:6-carboxy-5,6,7,8-tetrahydropterin synthase n=2 Tax=Cloacibacterium rupense TaxID=517423 RepID=A0ABQ2NF29_9FLAO|nr:6-carboxy-5,6,7,8-tetrahydropterin synthase [Cloacibacterium rupense]
MQTLKKSMKVTVTRRETFNAAHRLFNKNWSNEKNVEVFGKCSNPNFHGHNYVLFVSISGEISEETGYVIDLNILKQIIRTEIIELLDHKNLNLDIDAFKELNPTVENIALFIFKTIKNKLPNEYQLSVKLYETENNIAEIQD